MSGFFSITREEFNSPIFQKEPMSEREAYIWLRSRAAYQDTTHRVGGELIPCPIGSVFITLRELQATTCWGSDTKIRNFLQRLEDAGLIERTVHGKRNARKTQVTICDLKKKPECDKKENAPKTHQERTKNAVKKEGNKGIREESKDTNVSLCAPIPANDLSHAVERFNAAADAAGWSRVQKLNPSRSKQMRARLKECGGLEGWEVALRKAFDSDFCRGRTDKAWHGFSFDWLLKPANFTKLMEGNYDNRSDKARQSTSGNSMVDAFGAVAAKYAAGSGAHNAGY